MAIVKHIPSQNARYHDAVDYLTKQHDEETGKPILDEFGGMIDRDEFLIAGINCTPDTFAEKCFLDSLKYNANRNPNDVKTHQYIISYDPSDKEKGLTLEAAMEEGMRFARKNFPGHRVLVAAHPDGVNGSGNIHVHIIVSSLRFEEREPHAEYMKLNKDGTVKASEYRAGCKHQDTAKLRRYLFDQVQDYCREHGYTVCEGKSKKKVTDREYKAQKSGQETLDRDNENRRQKGQKVVQTKFVGKKDELRMAIDDAVANTDNWDEFVKRLRTHYTRRVEINPRNPAIPYLQKKEMWDEYKALNNGFWDWYKLKNREFGDRLSEAYRRLEYYKNLSWQARNQRNFIGRRLKAAAKLRETGGDRSSATRLEIASLGARLRKLKICRDIHKTYADAAALALKNNLEKDSKFCLQMMKDLQDLRKGIWVEGYREDTGSHAVIDGVVKSKITWTSLTEDDLNGAKKTLKAIKGKVREIEGIAANPQYREEPLPIDVKITRGVISFKHPDYENWTRGKTLGSEYEIEALSQKLEQNRKIENRRKKEKDEYFRLRDEEREDRKKRQAIEARQVSEDRKWRLDEQQRETVREYWDTYVALTKTGSFLQSLEYWKDVDPDMYEDQLEAWFEIDGWATEMGGYDRLQVDFMINGGDEPASDAEILAALETEFPDSDLISDYRERVRAQKEGSLESLIAAADTSRNGKQKEWNGADVHFNEER